MTVEQPVIGIDLGTTNTCVAVVENGEPRVLRNSEGGRTTPSVVAFLDDGTHYVGEIAKRQMITNPANTIYSVKRFMGRHFDEVKELVERVAYTVKPDAHGRAVLEVMGQTYSPQEISALLLQKMRETAEDALGTEVTKAVITVPAYFNDTQRQATRDAGRIAGLDVLRIINEPTAAALAHRLDKRNEANVAVYDLGGGTFDISILQVGEGVFEVLATSGNSMLGGDDFDRRLLQWLINEIRKEKGVDLSDDRMACQRLREAAEQAKCDLSSATSAIVNVPFITVTDEGPVHFSTTITQAKLEELVDDLISQTIGPCERALHDAGLDPSQIDEVVLVGGQTRTPAVIRTVERVFGRTPVRNANPDEVVAIGAAIQGGILAQSVQRLLLLDVAPHSLGIETKGGVCTRLIQRNTTIPTTRREIFTTVADGQDCVDIRVLQGERPYAQQNKLIGHFKLTGIPFAPRGVPKIEVAFTLDANGILNVSAKDLATGREQAIVIQTTGGFSEEEVQAMTGKARLIAMDSKRMRQLQDARNKAERALFETRKLLRSAGNSLSDEYRAKLRTAMERVEAILDSEDINEIENALEALQEERQLIGG